MSGRLGGKGVCDRHFLKLTFPLLRKSFCPDGEHDEFLDIYHKFMICAKPDSLIFTFYQLGCSCYLLQEVV